MTADEFRQLALCFPGITEVPHFDRRAFRTAKRIMATLVEAGDLAVLMLSPEDQDAFVVLGKGSLYPVPNKWGDRGATYVQLATVEPGLLADALDTAWERANR